MTRKGLASSLGFRRTSFLMRNLTYSLAWTLGGSFVFRADRGPNTRELSFRIFLNSTNQRIGVLDFECFGRAEG